MAGLAVAAAPVVHRSRGVVRTDIALTCDASGVATASVVGVGFGRLVGVAYDGGLDASAVITLSDSKTGAVIVQYTTGTEGTPVYFRPTGVIASNAGAAVAAALTAVGVNRDIYLGGKLSIGVTSGGVSETATLSIIVDEAGLGDPALTV